MNDEDWKEICKAWANGELVQYLNGDDEWVDWTSWDYISRFSARPGRDEEFWRIAPKEPKFRRGDRVRKVRDPEWVGIVVGEYASTLTHEGYCVESEHHPGSVQMCPAAALESAFNQEGAQR